MPNKLIHFPRLQKELEYFNLATAKTLNPATKRKCTEYLQEFYEQIQYIELGHSTEYNGYIKPKTLRENIHNLVTIRRKMKKLADDILKAH